MDGDGKLDLVVTSGQIMILRGRGDGSFAPHIDVCSGGTLGVPYEIGGNAGALAFGDFNGDGMLDTIDYPTGLLSEDPRPSLVLSGNSPKPAISPGGLVSAATYVSGPVSPGGLVAIFGDNLGVDACYGQGEEVLFNGFLPASFMPLLRRSTRKCHGRSLARPRCRSSH